VNKFLTSLLLFSAVMLAACSRDDKPAEASKPTPRPNLKQEAQQIQNAVMKAAEAARKQPASSPVKQSPPPPASSP
jgi:protein-disulfide isomerase